MSAVCSISKANVHAVQRVLSNQETQALTGGSDCLVHAESLVIVCSS